MRQNRFYKIWKKKSENRKTDISQRKKFPVDISVFCWSLLRLLYGFYLAFLCINISEAKKVF
ncbi:hypothetical protein DW669_12845 [Lachnospiraceae bacterium AM25-17]|nr:hypothetical protein DW669_12845 [Lachnospiraceae bacterium AM25-17]